jgi:chaperonin GroES
MIVPFLHRVLVKPAPVETKSEGGIILSLNEKREQASASQGTVLALGDTFGADYKTNVLPKVGDKVYFAQYAGRWIKENDEDLVILNDEDLLCIIKE